MKLKPSGLLSHLAHCCWAVFMWWVMSCVWWCVLCMVGNVSHIYPHIYPHYFVNTSVDQRVMGGLASAGKSHQSKSGLSCSLWWSVKPLNPFTSPCFKGERRLTGGIERSSQRTTTATETRFNRPVISPHSQAHTQ